MSARRPELLCPAGSPDSLRAAVNCGADAVYLGGSRFSARGNAENFDDTGIKNAVAFCSERGVKTYIALNTLIFENEIKSALEFACRCCEAGADALILQDIGLAALIRRAAPEMKLHASTQLSVFNDKGLIKAAQLGFSRVVLARELSFTEMSHVVLQAKSLGVETEVFVHGALCFSVSGQCLLSSALGERSANRGLCAQPCRLPFSAPGGTGHDLSLKDLCLLAHVRELSEIGVDSLKIEGRMKKPDYVAAAASVYSRAVRGEPVPPELFSRLAGAFSRSGFTDGYFTARHGRDMFGVRRPEDAAAAEKPQAPSGPGPVAAELFFEAAPGRPARLEVSDNEGNTAVSLGPEPKIAEKNGTGENFIEKQLLKTGGTPFFARQIKIVSAAGLFLSAGQLNAMRRGALAALAEKRRNRPLRFDVSLLDKTVLDDIKFQDNRQFQRGKKFSTKNEKTVENLPRPRLIGQNFAQIQEIGADDAQIFLPRAELLKNAQTVKKEAARGAFIGVQVPEAVFGSMPQALISELAECRSLGVKNALCPNIGFLEPLLKLGFSVHGDIGLNIANPFSFSQLLRQGAETAVLSPELTATQLGGTAAPAPHKAGVLVYGNLPAMLSRICPLKNGNGCKSCAHRLFDRKGRSFPVYCRENKSYCRLYNPVPLWLLDKPAEIKKTGAGFAEFLFSDETPAQVKEIFAAYKASLPCPSEFTRGHFETRVR